MQPSTNQINKRNDIFTLITVEDVKTYTPLRANVEPSQLKSSIFNAELLYIKNALGKTLYDELVNEFVAVQGNPNLLPDGSTLPNATNYKELYQQMKLALIWYSYYMIIPVLGIKLTEKGVEYQNSDFSDNGELKAINELESRALIVAKQHLDNLTCYIDKTFTSKRNEIVQESNNLSTTSQFIYIPKSHRCKSCTSKRLF